MESERIGIAQADLYPTFSINGTIGLGAENLSQIFDPLARFNKVGPGFHWNILNYGRIINSVRTQNAIFRESVTNYQNTVLSANQEVEDALVAFQKSQQQARVLSSSAEAMKRALDLELIRFKEGEDDFTGVFVFQSDLVQKQDQLAQTRGDAIASLVQLYKSLGGGWQVRCYGFPAVETPAPIGPVFETEAIELPAPETEEQEAIEEAETAEKEVAEEGAILLPPLESGVL